MITTRFQNKIIDAITGKSAFHNQRVYVGLSYSEPTESGGGVHEPSGNGYQRLAVSYWDPSFHTLMKPAEDGVSVNEKIGYFHESTDAWTNSSTGPLKYYVFFDDAESSDPENVVAYGRLRNEDDTQDLDLEVTQAGSVVYFREEHLKIQYGTGE